MSKLISNNELCPHLDPASTHTSDSITTPLPPPIGPLPNARLHNTPQHTQQPGRPPTHNPTLPAKECPKHPLLLETTWPYEPTIQHIQQHTLPCCPLTVLEFNEGTTTGLKALLKAAYHTGIYAWSYTNPDAHTTATHRLTQLQQQDPHKLPHTALLYSDALLPTNTNTITPEAIQAIFPDGIDIVIAGLPDNQPTTQITRHATHPTKNTLKNLIRLLHFLDSSQPTRIGYILTNTPSTKLHPTYKNS